MLSIQEAKSTTAIAAPTHPKDLVAIFLAAFKIAFFVKDFALPTISPAGIPSASRAQLAICYLVVGMSNCAIAIASIIEFASTSLENVSARSSSVMP